MAPDLPLMLSWGAIKGDIDLATAQLLCNFGQRRHARILRTAGDEEQAELLIRSRGVSQNPGGILFRSSGPAGGAPAAPRNTPELSKPTDAKTSSRFRPTFPAIPAPMDRPARARFSRPG